MLRNSRLLCALEKIPAPKHAKSETPNGRKNKIAPDSRRDRPRKNKITPVPSLQTAAKLKMEPFGKLRTGAKLK
jgi:hypothetical protein